ncbi:MAG: hypothetical protein ACP5JJ_01305 [Anaerolineae bacterium]
MPATARVYIKASILYLGIGAILGSLLLIHRWIPLGTWVLGLRVSHVQFLMVGWLTQLVLGVGWWLFPPLRIGLRSGKPLPGRRGQAQRGSEALFWATFAFLNLGILLRGIFEPLYVWTGIANFQVLASVSGFFLLAAAIAFVQNVWDRVRALGKDR